MSSASRRSITTRSGSRSSTPATRRRPRPSNARRGVPTHVTTRPMVIIYGRRAYGRVDAHGGEYAHTTFAHLWYMPLFPIQSYWITQDGEAPLGFEIGFHGRSVLAAYLRMWAPLAAIACLATGAPFIGAAFAALGVWAWLWRRAPASRRSDFNLVAYGTRCEPSRMPREMRDRVKRSLDSRWEGLALGKPPEDIAQFG